MKKILLPVIAMVLLVFCVSGCTSGNSSLLIKSIEKSGNGYWQISYEKFDGSQERVVAMSGTGEHTFSIDIVTNSGTLGLSIKDQDGTSLYSGKELPSSSFAVIVDGEGEYTIRFDAVSHSGSFDVKWE